MLAFTIEGNKITKGIEASEILPNKWAIILGESSNSKIIIEDKRSKPKREIVVTNDELIQHRFCDFQLKIRNSKPYIIKPSQVEKKSFIVRIKTIGRFTKKPELYGRIKFPVDRKNFVIVEQASSARNDWEDALIIIDNPVNIYYNIQGFKKVYRINYIDLLSKAQEKVG